LVLLFQVKVLTKVFQEDEKLLGFKVGVIIWEAQAGVEKKVLNLRMILWDEVFLLIDYPLRR